MDTSRPATTDDAPRVVASATMPFCAINDEYRFTNDFPSAEVATGLLRMLRPI